MCKEPIHRIHLKGPWDYEWFEGPTGSATSAQDENLTMDYPLLKNFRVRMPSSVQETFGNMSGRVIFRRRFQRPTNLDSNERVHIAFDGIGGRADVAVNGKTLGSLSNNSETVSFDMTEVLEHSNELSVDLTIVWDDDVEPGGLFQPVAVEIHKDDT